MAGDRAPIAWDPRLFPSGIEYYPKPSLPRGLYRSKRLHDEPLRVGFLSPEESRLMPKPQYVRDLSQGTAVRSRFCVLNPQPASGNGPYKLTLRDRTGDLPAKIWPRSTRLSWPDLQAARFADVTGTVDYNGYSEGLEVTIVAFAPVEDPGELAEYLPRYRGSLSALKRDLHALVTSVADPSLRGLLRALFFEDEAFRQAYFDAPAAQHMHHAYIGGLLEHSLEVARICDAVARALPGLHRDLLVTAALLHDIGKIEEIDYRTPGFPFTRAGGMLRHVFLGAQRVYRLLDSLEPCPDGLSDALCHLLLSHQGKPEWGAPVHPCSREAFVLHAADDLSAKSYHCREAAAASGKPNQGLFQKSPGLAGRVYTGSFAWDASGAVPAASGGLPAFPPDGPAGEEGLPDNVILLPILGSVAAGLPNEEREDVEGFYPLPQSGPASEGDYLLRVKGDSMVGAHLLDGDLAHVRPEEPVREGDIVVALVDGESTVKRLSSEGGRTVLRPANPDYPVIVPAGDLTIQGKVIGAIRPAL